MLQTKDNYVPWSSCLLRLQRLELRIEKTYDELTDQEMKQVEADDQAIQTILMGLREDIYAAIDSFLGMSVWEGAKEKEPTSWEGVKTQLDTAQEVQSIIHIKAECVRLQAEEIKLEHSSRSRSLVAADVAASGISCMAHEKLDVA
ncbi:hypothetical protein Tco_0111268 [Tanacetum coccineum]